MKKILFICFSFCLLACKNDSKYETIYQEENIKRDVTQKVQVLNFGTFHFGSTPDANTTDFDENDPFNKQKAHEVAQLIAAFKPTVIIVETSPNSNKEIQRLFEAYKKNPEMKFNRNSEMNLIAFEVGRLANAKRIYGIDHQLGYNYKIGDQIKNNKIDADTYNDFQKHPLRHASISNPSLDALSLLDQLKTINSDEYLDYLYQINADILTYVGKEDGFEGADVAADFYRRNLRMFSNLNKIPLSEKDRVFLFMGAGHTAFFRDFLKRSTKYTPVSALELLNK